MTYEVFEAACLWFLYGTGICAAAAMAASFVLDVIEWIEDGRRG